MSRPTLRQLEYAVAVDDHGGFGRAAAALFVSQPGLSSQIAELERRLGVVLFERSRSSCTPTTAGREVLERARRVLLEVDDLARSVAVHRDTVVGEVRVAAIPTIAPYLLSSVARRMRRLWPEADLELLELRTTDLVDAVSRGRVDVGLLAMPVDTASLEVTDLVFEPFVLAAAESNPIVEETAITAERLAELEVLLLEDGHCLRDHVLAVCRLAGSTRHRSVHQTSLAVLTQMVASSDAVTLLPRAAVDVEARAGSGVAVVPFADLAAGRRLSLVWRRGDPRSDLYAQAVDEVIDAIGSVIAFAST